MLKNLSALYLLKRWMDFNQTCTDMSFGDAKEVNTFLVIFTLLSRTQEVKKH